jgi:hypothetical protein
MRLDRRHPDLLLAGDASSSRAWPRACRDRQRRQDRGSDLAPRHDFTNAPLNQPAAAVCRRMGPIVGVVLPAAALLAARRFKLRGWYVLQFFSGFCLIANGAYLAFGSLARIGDAGDLLRHNARIVLLWLFGVATISVGLWMWNGLGPHFGLGEGRGTVDSTVAYVILALTIAIVLVELALT